MWPIWHSKRHQKAAVTPRCSSCGKSESVVYWSRLELTAGPSSTSAVATADDEDSDDMLATSSDDVDLQQRLLCNECRAASVSASHSDKTSSSSTTCPLLGDDGPSGDGIVLLRKSRRAATSARAAAAAAANRPSTAPQSVKCAAPKGKSRRTIFKKSATKAPAAVATVVTTGSIFHKGIYYQIGDVVSMVDVKGGVYYAQIRGLLQDQYCEKSAVVTWLLPTESSPDPESGFDPNTYIIGPEEDIPRRLDCMDFVCHAPSEYFKAKNSPYPTVTQTKPELGFIWTRLRPQIKVIRDKRDNLFESGS